MFRSMLAGKSRHRAAILAGAIAGTLVPLAAQASVTISLQTTLGAAGAAGGTQTVKYLTPDNTATDVPVFVYATVTGATSVTGGTNFQGFQYGYYNINFANVHAAINATLDAGTTAFTAATNDNFSGNGSFVGSTANTGSGILAGSTTVISDIAHARSLSTLPVWNNSAVAAGKAYVSADGKSVSFLVETLQVKPGAFTVSTAAANSQNYTKFSVTTPSLAALDATVQSANWNEDSNTTASDGSSTSIKNTSTGSYGATTSFVTFEDTVNGDANANGGVDSNDLLAVLQHFGVTTSSWANGSFLAATGHAATDPTVDSNDLLIVLQNFNQTLVPITPTVIGADSALLADPQAVALLESFNFVPTAVVPEPMSLGIMGLVGVAALGRRRRRA
jgi:hypothetical protein